MTVRVRPLPAVRVYEGWRFPSFDAGTRALRALAQDGPRPTVLRLSDETETFIGLAHPDRIGDGAAPAGCMAVVGFEGTEADTALRRSGAREVLLAAGGEYAGEEPGERWARGRYDAPTCGTRCSTRVPSRRPWRPPRSGRGCPDCTPPCGRP